MENKDDKKIVQLSDQDLIDDGFMGDGAPESVRLTVEMARAHPELWEDLTWFMLECQTLSAQQGDQPPTSPSFSYGDTLISQVSRASHANTAAAPHLVSEFERKHYYHGISPDPPELLYRSDFESNPFLLPPLGARWFEIPLKTAEGVFETPLNPVWHTVAPLIIALLKQRRIKYSALKSARFSTRDEDGKKTLGPIVIWIATHPITSAENARDASPDILRILEEHKVKGAVVEWYEGSVEKLSGPALMRVVDEANPTCCVRRPLTTVLGMSIATREREDVDAQGSVAFFFHENKDRNGNPSARVLGVSNKHVLCADTTVDYQFMGTRAPRQYVRVCGMRRFQRLLGDTRALVTNNVAEAVRLTEEIARLKAKPASNDPELAEEDWEALDTKQAQLKKVKKDNVRLQAFFKEINTQWHDIARRNIGYVDWAPKIAMDIDETHYTRDVGTFELDPQKFKNNFRGNFVDLGNKYSCHELNTMFWPNNTNPSGIKFPSDRMLRIEGVVTRDQLANPDSFDENGDPVYIVGKDGCRTDFTLGRYSGLEAYLCDEFGKESIEVAVYNYSQTSGNFSGKGDSGSLIFTGGGLMLAILHSGMQGLSSHVTYGTPAWWVVRQLKLHYKHADFNRTTFFPA